MFLPWRQSSALKTRLELAFPLSHAICMLDHLGDPCQHLRYRGSLARSPKVFMKPVLPPTSFSQQFRFDIHDAETTSHLECV